MLRTRTAAAVAATLALTALACWAAAARATTHAPKAPTRIVSLSPTATEDLFAIGAGPQVIAVDDQSDYPKQAPKTRLSAYKPNAEAIAKYRPDLVVVSDETVVAALHKLGIRTVVEPAASNLNDAYAQIVGLGAATGHAARAAQLVARMKAQLSRIVASVPHQPLKVFDELEPDLYSVTSKTFIGSLFTLFGLTNIADAADKTGSGYPQLSDEYVIAENPDIVVLSDTRCCGQSPKTVAARPGWSNVSAVRHQGVVSVDDDVASRWGPRIVQFARAIAAGIRRYR